MDNNWEYHQDARDRAAFIGSMFLLVNLGLLAIGVVIAIILMVIWMP